MTLGGTQIKKRSEKQMIWSKNKWEEGKKWWMESRSMRGSSQWCIYTSETSLASWMLQMLDLLSVKARAIGGINGGWPLSQMSNLLYSDGKVLRGLWATPSFRSNSKYWQVAPETERGGERKHGEGEDRIREQRERKENERRGGEEPKEKREERRRGGGRRRKTRRQ